jgi:iron complex outermembrane recepter protein
VGNANFSKEQSTNLDIGVKWARGANNFGISAFVNQFNNYIALDATGVLRDSDGNGGAGASVTDSGKGDNTSLESGGTAGIFPEFAYSQVGARFTGLEASGNIRLIDAGQTLDLALSADLVRATNTSTGQNLPRIAPARVGAALAWSQGAWGAGFAINHVAAQTDVAPGQPTTVAYTMLNASLRYQQKLGASTLLWIAKIDNLSDVLAYSATSILTQTAPGKAPLPGRSLKLGLQASF